MNTSFWQKLEQPLGLAILDLTNYYNKGLIITRINVPDEHRGKGIGSQLLKSCCAAADEEGVDLWLEIAPTDGLDFHQLELWYTRHNFNWVRGADLMVRRALKKGGR